MKKLIVLLFIVSCASKNSDWDNGARKAQTYGDEQRQEQARETNIQFQSIGAPGFQNQPFH
jgi:hypothetical protein